MKKYVTLTGLKPFLMTSLFTLFSSYASMANASLSSVPATPNQIRIVAKAATPEQIEQQISRKEVKTAPHNQNASSANQASQKVNNIYRKWAGTRYRLGGSGVGGIDCSAFVQKTMSGAFNVHLPRSTAEQRYSGRSISKSDLRPGDLVFFRKNNHVGVYIGGGKFVHASSSRGVTTSSLSESYWARNYTQSRRVL
ncbi:NlpC/P60 family protein [Actinobacillus minor]|uniref:NlpC/P60 family protein n=1 Tax=Actinobacillus minor TaxID=51047 RepID=UPI0026E94C7B|nr:NlpC/P60 family protein [Actinobacillus minor]